MNNKSLKFSKYSGNGNDFIILDHPEVEMTPELVQRLCSRHFGVGADGVLTLGLREGFDGEMRIYNADGGEAEMCGNGLRCLATYLDDKSDGEKEAYRIKTMNGSYSVMKKNGSFAIEMSEIKDENRFDLSEFNEFDQKYFVNSGVPHLVFLGQEIKNIDMKLMAPKYRYHSMFPGGTNVNVVEVLDQAKQIAYVRTYERGVEDETHSCGTGLTASALALSHWLGWKGDITLMNKGGKQMVSVGDKIYYSGEVTRAFTGVVEI